MPFFRKNISSQNFSLHLFIHFTLIHFMYDNCICIINPQKMSISFFFFCFPFLSRWPSVRPFFCLILVVSSILWSVGRPVSQSFYLPAFLPSLLPFFHSSLILFFHYLLSLSLRLLLHLHLSRCTSVVCLFADCFSEFVPSIRSPVLVRA